MCLFRWNIVRCIKRIAYKVYKVYKEAHPLPFYCASSAVIAGIVPEYSLLNYWMWNITYFRLHVQTTIMKHSNPFYPKPVLLPALIFILILTTALPASGQTVTPRYIYPANLYSWSDTKVYNIKGDFQMIGNTNLTLQTYSVTGTNSADMIYVDKDDGATFKFLISWAFSPPKTSHSGLYRHYLRRVVLAGQSIDNE